MMLKIAGALTSRAVFEKEDSERLIIRIEEVQVGVIMNPAAGRFHGRREPMHRSETNMVPD